MTTPKKTVVVGMSGGVDSSVAALLLKKQGFHVIGMFMKNWEEKDENGVCTSSQDFEDVVRVCEQIDIPYYSVNFVKEYWDSVFQHFLKGLEKGLTPNPDILCNREIKFKVLLEKALEIGGDFLATGHYCRKAEEGDGGRLLKGTDPAKDQSYFLYTLSSNTLKNVLFPVGDMLKGDLRRLASEHGLATSQKKDSTGICFIGERNFKKFLQQYIAYQPGEFKTLRGETVGTHDGIAYYTIGQRKGMGIGGAGEPWFVVGKDVGKNVVYIERGGRHPALYCDELTASDLTWVSQNVPRLPFACKSKIRYRQADQECVIEKIENNRAYVRFLVPQRAVTLQQSIVFYSGDICLGGGIIETSGPSYFEQNRPLPGSTSE